MRTQTIAIFAPLWRIPRNAGPDSSDMVTAFGQVRGKGLTEHREAGAFSETNIRDGEGQRLSLDGFVEVMAARFPEV
jgi:hypothetical protein